MASCKRCKFESMCSDHNRVRCYANEYKYFEHKEMMCNIKDRCSNKNCTLTESVHICITHGYAYFKSRTITRYEMMEKV